MVLVNLPSKRVATTASRPVAGLCRNIVVSNHSAPRCHLRNGRQHQPGLRGLVARVNQAADTDVAVTAESAGPAAAQPSSERTITNSVLLHGVVITKAHEVPLEGAGRTVRATLAVEDPAVYVQVQFSGPIAAAALKAAQPGQALTVKGKLQHSQEGHLVVAAHWLAGGPGQGEAREPRGPRSHHSTVLQRYNGGASVADVAQELHITPRTVLDTLTRGVAAGEPLDVKRFAADVGLAGQVTPADLQRGLEAYLESAGDNAPKRKDGGLSTKPIVQFLGSSLPGFASQSPDAQYRQVQVALAVRARGSTLTALLAQQQQ